MRYEVDVWGTYLSVWNGHDLEEEVYLLGLPPLMVVPLRFKGPTDSSEFLHHIICEIKRDCWGCLCAWVFHCVSGFLARRFGRLHATVLINFLHGMDMT